MKPEISTDKVDEDRIVATAAKFVAGGAETCEIGCGPDLLNPVTNTKEQDKTNRQLEEDKKQSHSNNSSDNESEMAETLIQKCYVEKKADRLIKELQTESDDGDTSQIEEVKSAVKQIQLEVELSDEENLRIRKEMHPDASSASAEEVPAIDMAQNQPVEVLTSQATDTPPPVADSKLRTGSSALESQRSSSQSNGVGGGGGGTALAQKTDDEEAEIENNERKASFNAKKSLLTSTGCGPDGSQRTVDLPNKMTTTGAKKIKVKKKVDQRAHIQKFSASLVFNAIERVTKAGSELIVRNQELENPMQQMNQNKILYDFDSETGLEACRKYLECLENLFALSFLKRASRDYR